MVRFLTPAKISLLALIELYTDAVVPTESSINVVSFVVSHLLPCTLPRTYCPVTGSNADPGSFTIPIERFEELLTDHPAASGLPGRTLWDLFLKKLWEIDSLHALHDFFERRSHLLVKTREDIMMDSEMGIPPPSQDMILLSRTSPFGAFVRKAHLEFMRLKFHDSLNLWKSFVSYRHTTLSAWQRRNLDAGYWSFDVVLHEGDDEWGNGDLETFSGISYGGLLSQPEDDEGFVSTEDVQKLLEFQIGQMQKLGTRLPDNVQERFKSVLSSNVKMPSLSHYVSFLEAWRAGDYPTSFDSLHRFFDYTMQNRDRSFYQYALLNLAVLEADFGGYQEAVTAMQEAVSVARENIDMSCLNFSLSWLYHFAKAHPKVIKETDKTNMLGVESEGLVFLRMKAKESGMWSLWSSALLSEAKAGLATGESVAAAFENIVRSSQLSVTKNMMNSVGAQMMLQSSIWGRLGVTHLAWSYCGIFLRCHSRNAPFEDILRFTCRAAYLLALKGHYHEGIEKIESLDTNSLRSLKASQYWSIFRGILMVRRDLHRDNPSSADQLLTQLLQCRGAEPDLDFELNKLHVDAMVRNGDYDGALSKIEDLAASLKEDGEDIYFRVELLITKALIFDKCGRPQKGFSIAVRAASVAWRARLLVSLWRAMGAVANILTSLEEFEASSQILVSVMPRVLECEDCALSAQLFSFLADAHMGIAGQAESESLKSIEHMTKAVAFLDRAFAQYSSIEDVGGQCEMMAKKATIMQVKGDMVLANDSASTYLALKKQAAQSRS